MGRIIIFKKSDFLCLRLRRYRVRVSVGVAILFLALLKPYRWEYFLFGVAFSFSGLVVRSWAAGVIEKSKTLAMEGPYAWIRHPLYFGNVLMATGFIFSTFNPVNPWPWIVVSSCVIVGLGVIYPATIRKEEESLLEKFGQSWLKYQANVPVFFPYQIPTSNGRRWSFCFQQYLKNSEHEAGLGWFIAVLIFTSALRSGY